MYETCHESDHWGTGLDRDRSPAERRPFVGNIDEGLTALSPHAVADAEFQTMRNTLVRAAGTVGLLYAARRYYRNWGTTKDECRMTLPGDELVKQPATRTTEGVSIEAPAETVWQALRRRIDPAMTVEQTVENSALVLREAPPQFPWESVVSYHVLPRLDDRCRLLVRTRIALRRPGQVLLAELAGPATSLRARGMLLGIKHDAEAALALTPR